ncbi:hypothetical protein GIB67_000875 [Kingdonia uniflora]|uniref:Zinc finger CCCH domain-containing protein 5 n=1 Tax=Kingdonia uniflora TaxID=39325 RepID=A0A7J7LG63_9MAGN|nr:hypothetical protein GIB67_000875 [Kingdonia uniflora]
MMLEDESITITRETQEQNPSSDQPETLITSSLCRNDKRKALKKLKRKQIRKETALKEQEELELRLNDPEEQQRVLLKEQEEAETIERQRKEFEEREKFWIEKCAKLAEEEAQRKVLEEDSRQNQVENGNASNEDDEWDYVEEGPAEIIWQGNEIIVKKNRVRVPKRIDQQPSNEDVGRPTSNPLPPQSEAYASYKNTSVSSQKVFESVAQQTPNFGTEQDKSHCPFHIKTGACRFGPRCSRVHLYPDHSCTLLIKNMYHGPGLAWEQDEGLECTDEEIERCYEEFYEDVHTEFLKFGEIVNFKVCKNGSSHLRGNVYVHYTSLESASLAYRSINGRFFAGKQITCEFVGVTRWKVAICGEYMKSRLKACSRGTACNFIHCFRNPGGDYEWSDWDKPPPKYWVEKMAALFGSADDNGYDKHMDLESWGHTRISSKKITKYDRYQSRRSRSRDVDCLDNNSIGDSSDEKRSQRNSHLSRQNSSYTSRKKRRSSNEHGQVEESPDSENDLYERSKYRHRDKERRKNHSRTTSSRRSKWEENPDHHENFEKPRKPRHSEKADRYDRWEARTGSSDDNETPKTNYDYEDPEPNMGRSNRKKRLKSPEEEKFYSDEDSQFRENLEHYHTKKKKKKSKSANREINNKSVSRRESKVRSDNEQEESKDVIHEGVSHSRKHCSNSKSKKKSQENG